MPRFRWPILAPTLSALTNDKHRSQNRLTSASTHSRDIPGRQPSGSFGKAANREIRAAHIAGRAPERPQRMTTPNGGAILTSAIIRLIVIQTTTRAFG